MIRKAALIAGVVASFALILWNGYVVISQVKQMRRIAALTLQTSFVQAKISAVVKDLTDIEIGQRGYLLTNNISDLQPYTDAKDRIGDDFAKLREGVRDREAAETSVESEVESLVNSKQSEMDHSITLRKQGYRHRALQLVASTEGMDYMEKAREHLSSLSRAENGRLSSIETERSARLHKIANETIIASFALLILITCLFLLVRHHGRMLEEEAVRSAEKLASHDLQLAKVMGALSNEAQSKTFAIRSNARILLQEYGGFLPRHAHQCAEQIQEASVELEQLRQHLLDGSGAPIEKEMFQAVA